MALPLITATGNLTVDPEMHIGESGIARTKLRIACNQSKKINGEWVAGDPTFLDVILWRKLAEEAINELVKGDSVTVSGKLSVRNYETKEGKKGTAVEIEADVLAKTIKTPRNESAPISNASPASDPWVF